MTRVKKKVRKQKTRKSQKACDKRVKPPLPEKVRKPAKKRGHRVDRKKKEIDSMNEKRLLFLDEMKYSSRDLVPGYQIEGYEPFEIVYEGDGRWRITNLVIPNIRFRAFGNETRVREVVSKVKEQWVRECGMKKLSWRGNMVGHRESRTELASSSLAWIAPQRGEGDR